MQLSLKEKAFVIASVEKKIKADREADRRARAKRK
jgi:hypothetical protein